MEEWPILEYIHLMQLAVKIIREYSSQFTIPGLTILQAPRFMYTTCKLQPIPHWATSEYLPILEYNNT